MRDASAELRRGNAMVKLTQRVVAALPIGVTLVAISGEPQTSSGTMELGLGETAFVHLTSTAPTGKPVAAIRVKNPNREYQILKVTFEVDDASGKNQLKVRNGYDQLVFFFTSCQESQRSDRPQRLMIGAPPGGEAKVDMPS